MHCVMSTVPQLCQCVLQQYSTCMVQLSAKSSGRFAERLLRCSHTAACVSTVAAAAAAEAARCGRRMILSSYKMHYIHAVRCHHCSARHCQTLRNWCCVTTGRWCMKCAVIPHDTRGCMMSSHCSVHSVLLTGTQKSNSLTAEPRETTPYRTTAQH
jgi:hypothetical protein